MYSSFVHCVPRHFVYTRCRHRHDRRSRGRFVRSQPVTETPLASSRDRTLILDDGSTRFRCFGSRWSETRTWKNSEILPINYVSRACEQPRRRRAGTMRTLEVITRNYNQSLILSPRVDSSDEDRRVHCDRIHETLIFY